MRNKKKSIKQTSLLIMTHAFLNPGLEKSMSYQRILKSPLTSHVSINNQKKNVFSDFAKDMKSTRMITLRKNYAMFSEDV